MLKVNKLKNAHNKEVKCAIILYAKHRKSNGTVHQGD